MHYTEGTLIFAYIIRWSFLLQYYNGDHLSTSAFQLVVPQPHRHNHEYQMNRSFKLQQVKYDTIDQQLNNVNGGLTKDDIIKLQRQAETDAYSNHDNYAMNALFVNIEERPVPVPCEITSNELPKDLPAGCLLRIGPNGASSEEGFLDGDGIIHCVTLPPQTANANDGRSSTSSVPMYSCTYVQTNGRTLEYQSQQNGDNYKFRGTLGSAPNGWPMLQNLFQNGIEFQTLSCQKDTCNTAMAISGDRILALMEQSRPAEIEVGKDGRIETLGAMLDLDGAIQNAPITGGSFGAHGRTDPITKERVHVSYNSNEKPFVKVDTFEENWKLKSSQGVDVPAPIMVHDCVMTTNYVVIFDFPLTVRPRRFIQNQFPVEYEPNHGARIGLTLRNGKGTVWFDVEPGVVLHMANAYERVDGAVVIHGFKAVPNGDGSYIQEYSASFLHEWIVDPNNGTVIVDKCLNPNELVEFPAIEDKKLTNFCDYCYGLKTTSIGSPMKQFNTPATGVLLDGVVKFCLKDDEDMNAGDAIGKFIAPNGWHFVSEPTIVNKERKDGQYILLIMTEVPHDKRSRNHVEFALEMGAMKSKMIVLDGDDISKGPVSAINLPYHVNYGLHSLFVPWDRMK